MTNRAENVLDLEERAGLQAFGFTLEEDGATAVLSPREFTIETTGCMEVEVTHLNGDHLFMGCHDLCGTISGVEHRAERTAGEKDTERGAGLLELGFVDAGEWRGFRREGTVALAMQIKKKDRCHFDVHITFPNGDQLFVACDFLCGKIKGIEWADSYQREFHGMDPSPLLAWISA